MNNWISVKERLPEIDVNDEPIDVELLTDSDEEIAHGYFDREWWIKQEDPMVGHVSLDTHPIYSEVTHWRYK